MTALPLIAFGMPGASEWVVIFLVVLVLFGAKRIPDLARSLGQAKKEFQKAAREVEEEVEKAKHDEPPPKPSTSPNNRAPDQSKHAG